MKSAVALLAHTYDEDSISDMERDVVALGMALLHYGHRLLLHASDSLALPLLLAAQTYRAPVVLEGSERAHCPIVMMPMYRDETSELADSALYHRVFVESTAAGESSKEEPVAVSLIDQLALLGVVDTRYLAQADVTPARVLEGEQARAVVALGWDETLADVVGAAERYSRKSSVSVPLLIVGERRGQLADTDNWRDVREFLDYAAPDIAEPRADTLDPEAGDSAGPVSEEYLAAWHSARERAAMVLIADELARRLSDGEPADRGRTSS